MPYKDCNIPLVCLTWQVAQAEGQVKILMFFFFIYLFFFKLLKSSQILPCRICKNLKNFPALAI